MPFLTTQMLNNTINIILNDLIILAHIRVCLLNAKSSSLQFTMGISASEKRINKGG